LELVGLVGSGVPVARRKNNTNSCTDNELSQRLASPVYLQLYNESGSKYVRKKYHEINAEKHETEALNIPLLPAAVWRNSGDEGRHILWVCIFNNSQKTN